MLTLDDIAREASKLAGRRITAHRCRGWLDEDRAIIGLVDRENYLTVVIDFDNLEMPVEMLIERYLTPAISNLDSRAGPVVESC